MNELGRRSQKARNLEMAPIGSVCAYASAKPPSPDSLPFAFQKLEVDGSHQKMITRSSHVGLQKRRVCQLRVILPKQSSIMQITRHPQTL